MKGTFINITIEGDIYHLTIMVFIRFNYCKITHFPPFPHSTLQKEVSMLSQHFSGDLCSTFFIERIYINYLDLFCRGCLTSVPFTYSFSHLNQWKSVTFILYFEGQSNAILFYCSHGSIFGHQELFSWLHKFMLMVPNLIHYNMDYANLFLCISTTSHFTCETHGYQHHSNFLNFSVLVSVLYPSQDIWSCQNIHWDIWSMSH